MYRIANMKKLILLLALISINSSLFAQNTIERIEPPFWWVGMTNDSVQLMVKGEGISSSSPTIASNMISLDKIHQVDNPNYLFLDITISKDAKPGTIELEFIKNGTKEIVEFELLARRPNSKNREGFSSKDIMYLITVDRFANGNPANDNHPDLFEKVDRYDHAGRHGGDIEGIANHLDYLKALGFTSIWVSPVLENNQETYSYHGYSTTDFYKVDPRFGTNDEYVELGKLANSKGIKLIMDMIVNHCGSGHWWMDDLPSEDWINFGNKFTQTNHQKLVIQDPYRSEYDYKYMVDGWFVETMPDLNQRNPFLAKYLIQNAIWWIEYANLSGIRMDTYPYSDMDFMNDWACAVMNEYPNFNITGEEWSDNPNIVAHWQKGKVNSNGYTSCLPGMIDFPLRQALQNSLTGKNIFKLYEMQANDFIYADPYNFVVFLDNHDMDRFFTQVNKNIGQFKIGIAHVLTTRGIPQIYYGTELLFTNDTPDHGVIRRDYPGGWEGDTVNVFTGKGLTDQQISMLQFISKLMTWRNEKDVIHHGKLTHFVPENNVYVYFRSNDTEIVMVALNVSDVDYTLNLSRFKEILSSVTSGKNIETGETIHLTETIIVPGNSPLILEIHRE